MNKYYIPKPKVKIKCKKCNKNFLGISTQQFCSNKCRSQFNEKKFRERAFTAKYRKELWELLPKRCCCGKEANEIHHKTYNIPIRKIDYDKRKKDNKLAIENLNKMLKEYCQYLVPLCSSCHTRLHL